MFALTNIMPSYAAQTMMDVGAFWDRPIVGGMYNNRKKAGDHLKDLLLREYETNPPKPGHDQGRHASGGLGGCSRRTNMYTRADVGFWAALQAAGLDGDRVRVAWSGLRAKERG